jgi:hypothetical protein
MRHYAASQMIASQAHIGGCVQTPREHASIAITSNVYGQPVGTVRSDAVNGAANLIAHIVHTSEGVSA